MNMSGKTVLITGASRGIGAAAARVFAAAGAGVAMVARSSDAIAALADEIGSASLAIPCDVSQCGEVEEAVETTVSAFGGLDILINNAGAIEPISTLWLSDPDDWSHVFDINLKGVYYGTRAALRVMMEAGSGTILNLSSGAAGNPLEGWSHYCSSKAAAAMLTRCVDLECRANGIRAIGLTPGTVATEMQREIKASGVNPVSELDWSDHIPPEWPAKALLWMCSSDADEFLGQDVSLRDPEIRKRAGIDA